MRILLLACHELGIPDALAPLLQQLVDSFVHDCARPDSRALDPRSNHRCCHLPLDHPQK